MRYIRMRKITWRMTRCYYPSRMHSHSTPAHCTVLEMLYVFSLCIIAEQSVIPTSSSPVAPPPPSVAISRPFTAPDMHTPWRGSIPDLWTVPLEWLDIGMDDWGTVVRFLAGTRDLWHLQESRPALGPTHPSIQWVTGLKRPRLFSTKVTSWCHALLWRW